MGDHWVIYFTTCPTPVDSGNICHWREKSLVGVNFSDATLLQITPGGEITGTFYENMWIPCHSTKILEGGELVFVLYMSC